ncbi:AbiJ-NTD4 domain-containing protein [Bradyrhizobium australafricanum]|uniref:AbiJ-NTD4 domain-containing protein n=1 Tax=Bradyrhizobium australafricanum TaxID=2821406 RepID=UPI001CE2D05C|nr:hypothetical protein [Bradyrhizobium australafricanum]MCA6097622.1 hypothetical protein [Bradyrhizobium australafricanum]
MLTDIFAERYKLTPLWTKFTETERRLLVQTYRLFSEQACPFSEDNKTLWFDLQSRLSMELGQASLSPLTYNFMGTWNGQPHHYHGSWEMNHVCETWFLSDFGGNVSADRFVKERVSFIELAFRLVEERIATNNANLPAAIKQAEDFFGTRATRSGKPRFPGNYADSIRVKNEKTNKDFHQAVMELNARLRQAECNLHYHNGFVQRAGDDRMQAEIDTPFWELVSASKWKNVDTDIKEAIDLRDTDGRDPAFYAARSLESTIKIISSEKQLTTGREKGAHHYIDNLMSAKLIEVWEMEALKHFFTKVRNPFGHGPGSAPMPRLTDHQTNWAIENSMIWIKSLIRRV